MDTLKAFLRSLPDDEARKAFAAQCETSLGHLRNIIYGKPCSAELAALIDTNSGGKVTRQDLRPDDWSRVWPELASAEQGA